MGYRTHRQASLRLALVVLAVTTARSAAAQTPPPAQSSIEWQYGAFIDVGRLFSSTSPSNHLFRNRGTTPRVDKWDLNMTGAYLKKAPSESSRVGVELTVQEGHDSEIFGFSATAPNIGGADWLLHLGPTNVSYLAPVGKGLTIQGGIFASFIGYDGLYAKDNLTYTRPWTGDYTPYFMLGVNASYPVTSRLTATGFVVNGYWHLAHANDVPSFGGQLAYKATDRVTVKETVLIGPHQTDTALPVLAVLLGQHRRTESGTSDCGVRIPDRDGGRGDRGRSARVVDGRAGAGEVGGPWTVVRDRASRIRVGSRRSLDRGGAVREGVHIGSRVPEVVGAGTGDRHAGIPRRRFARSRRRLFHRAGRPPRRAGTDADPASVRRRPHLHVRRHRPSVGTPWTPSSSSSPSCSSCSRWRTSPRASGWSSQMTLDYIVGLLVTVGLLVYLTYALLRPEKF